MGNACISQSFVHDNISQGSKNDNKSNLQGFLSKPNESCSQSSKNEITNNFENVTTLDNYKPVVKSVSSQLVLEPAKDPNKSNIFISKFHEILFRLLYSGISTKRITLILISNITDSLVELSIVKEVIFPKLQKQFSTNSYELILIDLADLCSKDNSATNFLRQEFNLDIFEKAKTVSTTTFFVIFIKNKIGPLRLVNKLSDTTYQKINCKLGEDNILTSFYSKQSTNDYILNENIITQEHLETIMNESLKLVPEEIVNIFTSDFISEINWLSNEASNKQLKYLVIEQIFVDLPAYETDNFSKYFDLENTTVTNELRQHLLQMLINSPNMVKHTQTKLNWADKTTGLDCKMPKHERYLQNMVTDIEEMFTENVALNLDILALAKNKLEREVFAETVRHFYAVFTDKHSINIQFINGQFNYLDKLTHLSVIINKNVHNKLSAIVEDFNKDFQQSPNLVIITGPPFSGKSSCLKWFSLAFSKLNESTQLENDKHHLVLLRRIGHSPLSCCWPGLLASLLKELCLIFELNVEISLKATTKELSTELKSLLTNLHSTISVFILIDDIDLPIINSIDIMSEICDLQLPLNCKIIITSTTSIQNIKKDIKFLAIDLMSTSEIQEKQGNAMNVVHNNSRLKNNKFLTYDNFKIYESLLNTENKEANFISLDKVLTQIEDLFGFKLVAAVINVLANFTDLMGITFPVLFNILSPFSSTIINFLLHHVLFNFVSSYIDNNINLRYSICNQEILNYLTHRYKCNKYSDFTDYMTTTATCKFTRNLMIDIIQISPKYYTNIKLELLFQYILPYCHTILLLHLWTNSEITADPVFENIAQTVSILNFKLLWDHPLTVVKYLNTDVDQKPIQISNDLRIRTLEINKYISTLSETLPEFLSTLHTNNDTKSLNEIEINGISIFAEEYENIIATFSTKGNKICIWQIKELESNKNNEQHSVMCIKTFPNVPNPCNICILQNNPKMILIQSNRYLRVLNLSTEDLNSNLKNVLNLNRPYYSIVGKENIVILSRNAMCVELMNLYTGQLLSSFKVGEDRFLSSMIVSGNGIICVCGDDTNDPFALVIWNLKQKKLLYDIKTTGYQLDTTKGDISYSGNYFICIAYETGETSRNFVFCYNLTTGQLSKKIFPSFNTTCLAIHATEMIAVLGLENGLIQIWDFERAIIKFNLEGHTFPPNYLQLDNQHLCLSWDNTNSDNAIRLWNIKTGRCVGIYFCSTRVSCCKLLRRQLGVALAHENSENLTIVCFPNSSFPAINTELIF